KQATADDRVSALEKRLAERDEAAKKSADEAETRAAQGRVREYIGKDSDRWDLTATELGQSRLWDTIIAYRDLHGSVPDEAVPLLADEVEKSLVEQFQNVRRFRPAPGRESGASPPAKEAASAGKNSGKTLSNTSTSSAPTANGLSHDPDERRKQV